MSAVLSLPDAAAIQAAIQTLTAYHADQPARSGRGLEAMIAGAVLGAPRKAWLLPGSREIGCGLLRGATADRLTAARPWRVVPPGDDPAQRALQAVGMAMAGDPGNRTWVLQYPGHPTVLLRERDGQRAWLESVDIP